MVSSMGSSWISCTGGCLQWAHVLDTASHCFWQCSCTYFRQQAKYRVRLLVREFIVRIYKQKKHLSSNSFSSGANPRNRLLNRRLSISSNHLMSFYRKCVDDERTLQHYSLFAFQKCYTLIGSKTKRLVGRRGGLTFHAATLKKYRIELCKN